MEAHYIIEKFTRCPRCRSFSLKALTTDEIDRIPGILSRSVFVCNNCGAQYALRGNSLKEISSLLNEKKTISEKKEPVKIERKTNNRTVIGLIFLFCLIIGGILLIVHPWARDQEQTNAPQPRSEKNNKIEKSVPVAEEPPGEKIKTVEKPMPAAESPPDNVLPGINNKMEPTAHKIFDSSGMKVRNSYPDSSDQSHRWFFKRKAITIKRSKAQRVYIAGDPTGKSKWAVDDEISINGKSIKGCSGEMTTTGYIPESKQVLPYDITHLIPSDREIVLDVRLVDYGILWGNTSIFIVII